MSPRIVRALSSCLPVVLVAAVGTWACGGGGGLVEAPVLPSGAKFAVLPIGEDAGDAGAPARRPGTGPLREGQVFRGTSYCRTGPVAIVLRITELDDDEVHATAEVTQSRGGARGIYQLSGAYTQASGHLKLDAGDWVDESDELEASDIEGTVTASGFQARFAMAGCGSVTFRSEGAP